MSEDLRQYGYFDALYGRPSDLEICDTPGDVDSYLTGYRSGTAARAAMNSSEGTQDAPESTNSPLPYSFPSPYPSEVIEAKWKREK